MRKIKIRNGKIFLRDMDSTNGTFLLKDNMVVQFVEGYVDSSQPIVIGGKRYVIHDLLNIASDYIAVDDAETQIEFSEDLDRALG